MCPQKGSKAGERSRARVPCGRAEGAGSIQPGENEETSSLYSLKGDCSKVGVVLLPKLTSDRTRKTGFRMCFGRFGLHIGENF